MIISLFFTFLSFWLKSTPSSHKPAPAPILWQEAEDGLFYSEVSMPVKSSIGDSKIHFIRIDPEKFRFKLLCATENGFQKNDITKWCEGRNMPAGINAGMFHGENTIPSYQGLTNSGYTRNFSHVNNPVFSSDKAFICFNPKDTSMPVFQIADRTCQKLESIRNSYQTIIQGIRLFDCNQNVVWQKDKKKWSMCVMLTDRQSFIYFVHCRSPYTVHSFCQQLKTLIPELNRGIYLEGGPESSLYLNTKAQKWAFMGSYETGFWENDSNNRLWPLANVIGIVRK